MDKSYFEIGKPVKVMDFVGIILDIEETEHELFITVESAKRIILQQTTYDRLDYNLLPDVWSEATPMDVLQDVFAQMKLYPIQAQMFIQENTL